VSAGVERAIGLYCFVDTKLTICSPLALWMFISVPAWIVDPKFSSTTICC